MLPLVPCIGVAARRVSPHDTPLIATDNIATVNQGTVGARQKTVARGFFSLSSNSLLELDTKANRRFGLVSIVIVSYSRPSILIIVCRRPNFTSIYNRVIVHLA